MRALCPTAFEEFKTGVDENMNYTPEDFFFQYTANLYIMKTFCGDVDCVEDQTLGKLVPACLVTWTSLGWNFTGELMKSRDWLDVSET